MKQLRFRAWDAKHEEMIYMQNSGLQSFDFEGSYSLGFTVDGYSDFWAHEQYEESTKRASEFPVMQFVGKQDKNGIDIYEGDIVRLINMPDEKKADIMQGVGVVKWDDEDLKFVAYREGIYEMLLTWGGTKSIEVIGNIHENPELLTEPKL